MSNGKLMRVHNDFFHFFQRKKKETGKSMVKLQKEYVQKLKYIVDEEDDKLKKIKLKWQRIKIM